MKKKFIGSILLSCAVCSSLYATSLRDSVEQVINTNPDIISKYYNQKSFQLNVEEQRDDYYPTVDFTTYYEKSKTRYDHDDADPYSASKDGWNSTIQIEQVLYDGGKTPNEVEMYRHRYENIKYTNREFTQQVVLDVVNIYNDLVAYQEKIALDNYKIKVHEKYLKLAKDKEELSGESLDRILVSSKIKSIMDNYLEQEVNQQKAFSAYKRITGEELEGNICRANIDENLIPQTIDSAIELALRRNNEIVAQEEIIKEQAARRDVANSKFKPDLKLQVQGDWDNDLRSEENGREDIYRVRLQSQWNLYEGGKSSVVLQKEKITLLEERKKLDAIRDQVIDNIKGSYNTYYKLKKRIENLKEFIVDNQEIVDIYTSQLQDGSRTFIDVLNAETELFRTKVLLVDLEFSLFKEYYMILKSLNMLSDTILMQKNQVCKKYVFKEPVSKIAPKVEKTDAELSDELGLE